jgi:hypothetical protein
VLGLVEQGRDTLLGQCDLPFKLCVASNSLTSVRIHTCLDKSSAQDDATNNRLGDICAESGATIKMRILIQIVALQPNVQSVRSV